MSKSKKEKQNIETRRYNAWKKSYYARNIEQQKITSQKCSIASKKRKQYFITIKNLDSGIIESKFLNDWLSSGYARDGIMDRIKKNNLNKPLFSRTKNHNIIIISYDKR